MRTTTTTMEEEDECLFDNDDFIVADTKSMSQPVFDILTDGVDKSSLHMAALLGKLDLVKECIESRGFNVEERSGDGKTPLHYASVSGNLDLVKYLVEKCGANMNVRDDNDLTPTDCALMVLMEGR